MGAFAESLLDVVAVTMEAGRPPHNAAQMARTPPGLAQENRLTWGCREAIYIAHHEAAMGGRTHASLHDLVRGALRVDEGWPEGEGSRDRLLEGAWPLAGTLLREIENGLARPLDAGDLLLLLASIPGGIVSEALSSLGVDADSLGQSLEEARRAGARSELLWSREYLAREAEARVARETATELERLAERRDELHHQWDVVCFGVEQRRSEVLHELRSRLQLEAS